MIRRKLAECCRPAGPVHQAHHRSKDHKEDQNSHIVAVRENVYHSVLKNMGDRSLKAETGIQDSTHENTDEQGTVHLFCDKCQPDRHDRRNERPERRVDRRHILFCLLRAKYGCHEHQDQHHGKHCCPFYIFLHIRHNGFLPPASGEFHALRFSCYMKKSPLISTILVKGDHNIHN